MLKRAVFGIVLTLLLISMLTLRFKIQAVNAEPKTWTVDDDGPADFHTIQEAIDAANLGDIIFVKIGIYHENVVINKTISLIGEDEETTVIDGSGFGIVVNVTANGVSLSNFTIQNSGDSSYPDSGIYLTGSYATIRNNILTNNGVSTLLHLSSNNVIYGNLIINSKAGLTLDDSCNNNLIKNNTVTQIKYDAVRIWGSSNNRLLQNMITDNPGYAIYLSSSYNSTLIGNTIARNSYIVIQIHTSGNNSIYHNNFINNTGHISIYNSANDVWDNGYPSGGNYWSDYGGVDIYSGPSQNETGIDGIGDTPYIIDEDNQDNYPLMNSWFLAWGNWSHYHSYIETIRVLLYLNDTYPEIVDIFSIGESWQNRDIYCIRLTNESITHPKPKVFFVGYHHAREPISAELPLYFAVEAATKFGTNETITRMLNYSEIYIVPMSNVDAFEAFKQNEWQRKNVHPFDEDDDALLDEDPPDDEDGDGYIEDLFFDNGTDYWFIRWEGVDDDGDGSFNEDWIGGVDLNRNYGYQWNATCDSGSPYPWAEDYRGPAPFSEPETQAIRDLSLQQNFKYAVSFHSGAELILYPWGYTSTPTLHDTVFREIAANLSELTGAPYEQSAQLYTTSGVWDDWMYGNRSVFAFTCEIYANYSAWQYESGPEPDTWWEKGIKQAFNPDPNNIETTIQRWLPVFTYITNRAITEVHNIATTNVTPLKIIVGQGFSANINVTVANLGEFTETFTVTVYANTTSIASQVVTLTGGNSTTVTLTWNTNGFAKGNYTISAIADGDNAFIDEIVTVTIPGDLEGNFEVQLADLVILAMAYGSEPGDSNWNAVADIDDNGAVGLSDLVIMAKNYGKTDP